MCLEAVAAGGWQRGSPEGGGGGGSCSPLDLRNAIPSLCTEIGGGRLEDCRDVFWGGAAPAARWAHESGQAPLQLSLSGSKASRASRSAH